VLVWDPATAQDALTYSDHTAEVCGVAFDPHGHGCATVAGSLVLPDLPGEAILRDARGRPLHVLKGHAGGVAAVAYHPNGKQLATASFDGTVKVWEVATGREWFTLSGHKLPVTAVAFSADGKFLASGSGGVGTPIANDTPGEVKLWSLETQREIKAFAGHTGRVTCVLFHPDGKRLFTAAHDGTVRLWDMPSGGGVVFRKYDSPLTSLAFSPDAKRLAVGALAGGDLEAQTHVVSIWDITSGRETLALKGYSTYVVHAVAFTADDRRLACGLHDGTVKLWDLTTGHEVLHLKGHRNRVVGVAFAPDGTCLVSVSADRTVRVWCAPR
jgi:WD40 repeat protein